MNTQKKIGLLAAVCGLALLATAGHAQVPADIAAKVRAAGQSMDPSVGALYAPLFPEAVRKGVTIQRDIAYGAAPLQKLDVFTLDSAKGKTGLPVLLFVHGGGFTRGDKHGESFYPDNITWWAAKAGMVGVNIDYRLSPAAPWPGGAKDLASAIAWTKANIAKYGGDPNHIVLFGHSAGANHVADYAAHPEVRGAEAGSVKGAILLSPAYGAAGPVNPYYGKDTSAGLLADQAERLRAGPYPLFLGYAEFDPAAMKSTAKGLMDGICKTQSRCPASVELKDSNHFTEGMAVGTSDQQLTGPLLKWMATLKK